MGNDKVLCRGGLGEDAGWGRLRRPGGTLNQKSCVLSSVGAGWVWMMGGGACAALVDVPAPCWVLTSRRPGGCTRALLGTYVAPPWWMYPRPVGYLRRAALVDVPAPCWVLTSRRPGGCTRALLGTYVAPPWWMYPRPVGYLRRAALVDITAACGYLRHPACPNSTLLHDPPAQGDASVPTAPSTAPAPTRTIPFPTPSHEKLTRENGLGVDDGWRRLRRPWCDSIHRHGNVPRI